MKNGEDDHSQKNNNFGHLQEVNLCETSPVLREPVLEVGTLEDSDESVIVHL